MIGVGSLSVVFLLALAQDGIRTEPYAGWKEVLAMEAKHARIDLKVVPAVAGRIVHYALDGENIIFDNKDYVGKTLKDSDGKSLVQGYLGYQIDVGPKLRGIPSYLALWMGPYTWVRRPNRRVRLESPHDLSVGLSIEKEMALNAKTGALAVWQKMKNSSKKSRSYCLWDRTLCRGGGFVIVPLTQGRRYPQGWGLVGNKEYVGKKPKHPKVKMIDGALVVHAEGKRPSWDPTA